MTMNRLCQTTQPNLVRRLGFMGIRGRALSAASLAVVPFLALGALSARSSADVVLQPRAGAPLPGLTQTEIQRFFAGKTSYTTPFGPATGLGPVMNKSNCQSCHSNPVGGWGPIATTRFGMEEKGEFIEIGGGGGTLLQVLSINDGCREVLPPEATVTATRMTNSSLAFGMIEAIPDEAIAANEDPDDLDGDGISGRVHWVLPLEASPKSPLRAGRFGWKAQVATVLTFSADATRNELGISNALIPTDSPPNGDMELLASCDSVPDPEDHADASGFTFIERVTFFQRYLATPPQTPRSGMSGEAVFAAIGCARCHVPEWTTSGSKALEAAIRGKTIRPYSDFLLHDMGLLGDGVQDGDATEQEIRTPTLWNLRTRDPMLHDGSAAGGTFATRVTAAILAHGPIGEGAASAAAFANLSEVEKAQLVAFLDSLGRDEYDFDGDRSVTPMDLAMLADCRGRTDVTPDDPCAIGDVDQDGSIGPIDLEGMMLALSRGGFDAGADCDGDGVPNVAEIFAGAADADVDGVPDDCPLCPADFDRDGVVGANDLATVLAAWGTPDADLDGDGDTGATDLATVLAAWGGCV